MTFETEGIVDVHGDPQHQLGGSHLLRAVRRSTSPPTCQPASVTIGLPRKHRSTGLACPSGTPPATPPLNTWCSEGASYSYVTIGETEYTNIMETIYGSGDVTFNHG